MNVLYVATDAELKSSALVGGLGDVNTIASLPEICVGDKEEFAIQFVSGGGVPAGWQGDPGYTVQFAIGSFEGPLGGTFTVSYMSLATGGTSTTPELPYNCNAQQLETALNELPDIHAEGGLDVIGDAGGPFTIVFRRAKTGETGLFSASAINLLPYSGIYIAESEPVDANDATAKYIFRMRRALAAFSDKLQWVPSIQSEDKHEGFYQGSLNLNSINFISAVGGEELTSLAAEISVVFPDGSTRVFYQGCVIVLNKVATEAGFGELDLPEVLTIRVADGRYVRIAHFDGAIERLNILEVNVNDLAGRIEKTENSINQLSGDVKLLSDDLGDTSAAIEDLQTKVIGNTGKITGLQTDIARISEELKGLTPDNSGIQDLARRASNVGEYLFNTGRMVSAKRNPLRSLPLSFCISGIIQYVNNGMIVFNGDSTETQGIGIVMGGMSKVHIQVRVGASFVRRVYDFGSFFGERHSYVFNVLDTLDAEGFIETELFVDGVQVMPESRQGTLAGIPEVSTSLPLAIGSSRYNNISMLTGLLSRIKVFNRGLLNSSSSVSYSVADYVAGREPRPGDTSCILNLSDEISGNIVRDRSASFCDLVVYDNVCASKSLDIFTNTDEQTWLASGTKYFLGGKVLPDNCEVSPVLVADADCTVALRNGAGIQLDSVELVAGIPKLSKSFINLTDGRLLISPNVSAVTLKTNLKIRKF